MGRREEWDFRMRDTKEREEQGGGPPEGGGNELFGEDAEVGPSLTLAG